MEKVFSSITNCPNCGKILGYYLIWFKADKVKCSKCKSTYSASKIFPDIDKIDITPPKKSKIIVKKEKSKITMFLPPRGVTKENYQFIPVVIIFYMLVLGQLIWHPYQIKPTPIYIVVLLLGICFMLFIVILNFIFERYKVIITHENITVRKIRPLGVKTTTISFADIDNIWVSTTKMPLRHGRHYIEESIIISYNNNILSFPEYNKDCSAEWIMMIISLMILKSNMAND